MIYAIDVSGGMYHLIEQMFDFAKAQPDATNIVFFDTHIAQALEPSDELSSLIGGGGTLPDCVFDWMVQFAPTECVTIVTDGYFAPCDTQGIKAHCLLWGLDGITTLGVDRVGKMGMFETVTEKVS